MKSVRLVFVIFAVTGIVFLLVAAGTFLRTRSFVASASRADGVVIANVGYRGNQSTTYRPRVRWRTPGGEEFEFESTSGSRPPSFHVGERVTVVYSPGSPGDAIIDSFGQLYLLPLIFGSLGGPFTCLGLIPWYWMKRRKERDEWLMGNGRRIVAELDRVELNTSLRVNGRSPYRIVCQWFDPEGQKVHVFRSRNLWFNPSPYVKGKTILVMVDPADLRRYVVDTGFLPELAE